MPDCVLAADIGGTSIRVAKVSDTGRISHRLETPTPSGGGAEVVKVLIKLLDQIPRENVRAVGVDVPGLAYPNGDVWAPNIRGWKRMPLGKQLRKHFPLPVIVESDRNAFVVGEAWKGAARGSGNVVFVAVGTGIGTGILADGRLLRGHGELAGCVGWLAVRDEFLPQYAKMGCLESHAGGIGIGLAASHRLGRRVTAHEVCQLATQGDKQAQEILEEAGRYLGFALANLVSILNPEIIVVGGGVLEAGDLVLKEARQTMRRWAQPLAVRQTRLVRSRLGGAASLLGVARLALQTSKDSS
ncbi:MAG TPA: ROK family protein [Edaphobacter sp.]|nr:ROK family protein [Edaphobacter sp.]